MQCSRTINTVCVSGNLYLGTNIRFGVLGLVIQQSRMFYISVVHCYISHNGAQCIIDKQGKFHCHYNKLDHCVKNKNEQLLLL